MISQREARRLRSRVLALEAERELRTGRWASETMPSWKCIGRTSPPLSKTVEAVRIARLLNHAVVVVEDDDDLVLFACEKEVA